jgi:hypothetical protein
MRFDCLAQKGYEPKAIHLIQGFIATNITSFAGLDSAVWGSLAEPTSHAPDMIQVVDLPSPSTVGRFLKDKFLLWIPKLPGWLQILLTGSRRRPDIYGHYKFSNRRLDMVLLLIGNVAASLLMYAAVTSLYLTAGSASSIAGVIIVALTITICSILFQNQQFISMLAR